MKRFVSLCLAALAFCGPLRSQDPAPAPAAEAAPLLKNGSMEDDVDGNGWPDGWPSHESATREEEDGNHFLRLKSPGPNETVLLFHKIPLPAGAEALEMSWRQRVTDLRPGLKPWFDARIMLEFRDASDKVVKGAPGAPYVRKSTEGWQDKTIQFLVPEGATDFVMMPSLFQVETGTFDLDDFSLKVIDATELRAKAEVAAAERARKMQEVAAKRQAKASETLASENSLVSNGNFEADSKGIGFADGWGSAKDGLSWEEENGNHFLRMVSQTPGQMVMVYRTFDIPAGTQAIELTWRQRISGLKRGKNSWFDARIMLDALDASGKKTPKQPGAAVAGGDTKGAWVEKKKSVLVPEGTVSMALMPALFQVNSGTFELDDITVRPTDPAPLIAAAEKAAEQAKKAYVPMEEPQKDKWPVELKVQGNRLVDPQGKEVWLQGVNIPSLEWNPRGEQVERATLEAINNWKSNVIRVPVNDDYWFGRKDSNDGGEAYRKIVDQLITLAANRGVYVVLDLHRYRAPQPEFLDFWKDAATRYKNHPAVLFDLMNEPHGTTWEVWRDGGFVGKRIEADQAAFLSAEEKKKIEGFESPGMQAMLDAVRSTGAKNIAVVGGLDYAYQLDGILKGFGLKDDTGNGIMYSCHIYPWKSKWQKYLLDAAEKYPILLGEVGADAKKMDFMPAEHQEDWETWVPDILGLIQKHRLNWTGWCFHPSASPRMLLDKDFTPSPFWGQQAKDALAGKKFEFSGNLR
jgi:endoglucanase